MQLKDAKLFRQQAYVDGAWVDADNGQTIKVNNPATGEIIGSVPKMGAAETRRAIEAADKALPAWRALTAKERANKLRRWFDLMIENQDDLARLMTIEQGKPLAEAKGEIAYAASFLEWFGEEAKRIYGDTIPGHQPDKRIIVIKQPIGVTAAITPWNFPSAMITRKAGPALAAGCTMVLKPASQTPYSALALAELAERAGIPKGVFSVVTGSAGEVGGELTSNPIVRKLTFTGSTEIGRQLMAECAQDIKKVSLELGGNAPFIVFDDADLDAAVEGALISKYRNNGQTRSRNTSPTRSPRAPRWFPAASRTPSAAPSSSRPSWSTCRRTPWCPRTRPSARWRRCSASRTRPRSSPCPTTPSSAWRPTSTPATWPACSASPSNWSTAWSASTPA